MADLNELQASQSVKIAGSDSSGSESNFVNATVNGDLNTYDGLHVQGIYGTITVGTSAVHLKVGSSPLTGRKTLLIQNLSAKDIYWGFDSSVTTSNGLLLPKGGERTYTINENIEIWAISDTAGLNCRIAEMK